MKKAITFASIVCLVSWALAAVARFGSSKGTLETDRREFLSAVEVSRKAMER